MELRRPATNSANMTEVPTRAAQLISGIHMEAWHTVYLKDRSANQDVMLTDLDTFSSWPLLPCCTRLSFCSTGQCCTQSMVSHHLRLRQRSFVWGVCTRLYRCCFLVRLAHPWHLVHVETATSQCVHPAAAPTRAAHGMVGNYVTPTRKDIRRAWTRDPAALIARTQGRAAAITWSTWWASRSDAAQMPEVSRRHT